MPERPALDSTPAAAIRATSEATDPIGVRPILTPVALGAQRRRGEGADEAEFGRFLETQAGVSDRADGAGKRDLAEIDRVVRQGRAGERGNQRRRHREIGGGLTDFEAPGDVEIDVELAELQPGVRFQHRQHHGEPARLPTDDRAARRAQRGRRHERLDLDQKRPRALDPGEHGRARARGAVSTGEEQSRGVRHLGEPGAGHFEDADLVGRAETVLGRAQQAKGVRAVAFEREHRVDHVLDHPGTGDLAVLGHMPDEEQRRSARLGEADQRLSRASDLAHRARADSIASLHMVWIESMTTSFGASPEPERRNDVFDKRLRGDLHGRRGEAEAAGAKPHLSGQFFAGHIDDARAGSRHGGAGLDQKRRLADARLAADQRGRPRHEAAASDPVEFARSR